MSLRQSLSLVIASLFLTTSVYALTPVTYDLVITHGRIIDGSGKPAFKGDIGIKQDRIIAIGDLSHARFNRIINAHGMVVAPGFIDMLGQSSYSILVDPRAQAKIYQGITTEITGEGESSAPLNDYIRNENKVYFQHYKLNPDWVNLKGYFARLDRSRSAINLATFVGAAQVRQYVLHDANRAPTAIELNKMRELVAQAMQQGALGVSSDLIYAPSYYAKTPELIELAKVAARYGGIYASHIRNESNAEIAALDEAIKIGSDAHIPVEIFHLKVAGKQNWGKMPVIIEKINSARANGVDISADVYPYIAGMTSLGASIPPWFHENGNAKFIARLKDSNTREIIKREMRTLSQRWENLYMDVGGGDGILISSVMNRKLAQYEGKRLSYVAHMMGKADDIDALLDLFVADNGQTNAIYFMTNADDMKLALQQPWVGVCTDFEAQSTTGPLAGGKPHPRGYGTFPRILGRYVRDEHLFSLEEAIRKMTSLAANRVHLADRGLLQPGYYADIVIFDADKINDVATYDHPAQLSTGMQYVLVNGKFVIDNGKETGELPGRALRHKVSIPS